MSALKGWILGTSHESREGALSTSNGVLSQGQVSVSAAEYFERGNSQFAQGRLEAAVELYTQAIDMAASFFLPDHYLYYASRSACYYRLGLYNQSAADARSCVALEPYTAGYIRLAATVLTMLTTRVFDHQLFVEARDSLSHARALIDPIAGQDQAQLGEIAKLTAKLNQLQADFFARFHNWPGHLIIATLKDAGIKGKDSARVHRLVNLKDTDTLMTHALRLARSKLTAPLLADVLLALHMPAEFGSVASSGLVGFLNSAGDDVLKKLIETADSFGSARADRSGFNDREQLATRAKAAVVQLEKEAERMLLVGAKSLVVGALVKTGICGGTRNSFDSDSVDEETGGALGAILNQSHQIKRVVDFVNVFQEGRCLDIQRISKTCFDIQKPSTASKKPSKKDPQKCLEQVQQEASELQANQKREAEHTVTETVPDDASRVKTTPTTSRKSDVWRVKTKIDSIQDRARWLDFPSSDANQLMQAAMPLICAGGVLTKSRLIDLLSAIGKISTEKQKKKKESDRFSEELPRSDLFSPEEACNILRRGARSLATQILLEEAGLRHTDKVEVEARIRAIAAPGKNAKETQQKERQAMHVLDVLMPLVCGELTKSTLVNVLVAFGMTPNEANEMLSHATMAPCVVLVAPQSALAVAEAMPASIVAGLESWRVAVSSAYGAAEAEHSATEAELVELVASAGGSMLDFIFRSMPLQYVDSPLPLSGCNAGFSFLQLVVSCCSHGDEGRGLLEGNEQRQLAVLLDWWLRRSDSDLQELPTSGAAAVAHAVRMKMPAVLQVKCMSF
jgi:tetratricopeptide (TPR) repeat protein